MRRGKLIGLGVGPGDPELMTVKGMRLLERTAVIAFIAAVGRPSRAREIAAPYIQPGTRELMAVMPMTQDPEATGRAYTQLLTGIIGELGQGHDVVFLCEGDPLLYGSFAHLLGRLASRFECSIIPGITSMTAAAAEAKTPLSQGGDVLSVIPATSPTKRLDTLLRDADRVVILKVGRQLAKVRDALHRARMTEGALLIENVTTPQQKVTPLADAGDQTPYFSLVLAGRKRTPR